MGINDRPATVLERADGLDSLITVRLIQIGTYAVDVAATPSTDRAEKIRVLDELVTATSRIPAEMTVPLHLQPLAGLTTGGSLAAVQALAPSLRARLTNRARQVALIEAATSTAWPNGVSWATDRDLGLAETASLFMPPVNAEEVAQVAQTYRSALKRLQKDSRAPGLQMTQVAVMTAFTAVSGGMATGIGTLVGTHFLGLSGAAATSAGLALLGGGSLASGGFGMAGGLFLLHSAGHVASFGTRQALLRLASISPDAFLDTLAKLDVLVALDPSQIAQAITELTRMRVDLQADLKAIQPKDLGARRTRIAQSVLRAASLPTDIPRAIRTIQTEVSAEERGLARALRGVDFELRHLRSSEWKRTVARLPRNMGVPSASKLLDLI